MIQKIVVKGCMGLLILFMGCILLRAFTQNVLIERFALYNGFTQAVLFDMPPSPPYITNPIPWERLYPVQDAPEARVSALDRLKGRVEALKPKIEQYTQEILVNRDMFVEWAIVYEQLMGWDFLNAGVLDLGDGYLSEVVTKQDVAPSASALQGFYEFLRREGMAFLYVLAPYKIAPKDRIAGSRDFSNQNADDFLDALALRQVPALDLRTFIGPEPQDHHALFYKTDHHWKAETGLWASGILMDHLNRQYGFAFDLALASPGSYDHRVYQEWFLGSRGKKVTLVHAQAEDFTLIIPAFTEDFSLKIPDIGLDRRGQGDIFYDLYHLATKNYYHLSPYGAYMYGDRPVITVHNHYIPAGEGKKLLLIKDSFANVVSPFISPGLEDLHILDLRHYHGSVQGYIAQHKPDMVVVLYNPSVLAGRPEMFDFR
ncbi:MAG: hypothetical protein LBD74_06165 [Spirochaetaceae bacterium]|nr:hypothetical protein [Spirochaetaceae bacterium]